MNLFKPIIATILIAAGIVASAQDRPRGPLRQTPPGPCDDLYGEEFFKCLQWLYSVGGGDPDMTGRDPVEICQAQCVKGYLICAGKSGGSPIKLAICEAEKFNCFIGCSVNE